MKLAEMQVSQFCDVLASDAPAPGGGSTAALEGALGAALYRRTGCRTNRWRCGTTIGMEGFVCGKITNPGIEKNFKGGSR